MIRRTLFQLFCALGVLTACTTNTESTSTSGLNSDSIKALYKNKKDSIPPTVKWCTELPPSKDTGGVEGLTAGALSIYTWKWAKGVPRIIKVRFNDGVPEIQDRVKRIAAKWEPFIGARFVFVPINQSADIKISFASRGVSWSRRGNESKEYNPSMNFGWLHDEKVDSLFESVVLHEFGHAIGLVHEHQLPDGNPIRWNEAEVYRYYLNYPNYWEVDDVKTNVFNRYNRNQLIAGTFDPNSIMMYHIPAKFTTNNYSTPLNVRLSEEDKRLVADVYLR